MVPETLWPLEPEHLLADFVLTLADPHPIKWDMGPRIILSFIPLFIQWIFTEYLPYESSVLPGSGDET